MLWTAEAVILELETAGQTLLMMRSDDGRPPGFPRTAAEARLERRKVIIRWPVPDAAAVSHMDRTLLVWPSLIPRENATLRRLVSRRALVDPTLDTSRKIYLWPWRRLAAAEGVSHEACRKWHAKGIAMIVATLNAREAALA